MDKPALGHTDFGKVKNPLALGCFLQGKGGGQESMGVPSPRRVDREGTGLESLGWAFMLSSSMYSTWAVSGSPGQEPPHTPSLALSMTLLTS